MNDEAVRSLCAAILTGLIEDYRFALETENQTSIRYCETIIMSQWIDLLCSPFGLVQEDIIIFCKGGNKRERKGIFVSDKTVRH